jgi:glutamate synthase (NADH)
LAFLQASNDAGFELPPPGEYDLGMFFMPTNEKPRENRKTEFKKVGVAHCHQVSFKETFMLHYLFINLSM